MRIPKPRIDGRVPESEKDVIYNRAYVGSTPTPTTVSP
jgi:hypothetical protein